MKSLLTLSDIADYLNVSNKTISKMVKEGQIPCIKIGHQWRFSESIINEWLKDKMKHHKEDLVAK